MSKMETLGKAYKKFDTFLDKGLITTLKDRFKAKGNTPVLSKSKAVTVFDPKKALPSKLPSAAKKVGKLSTLRKVGRLASRAALPLAAGVEAANIVYKVATRSPEEKARTKKLKTRLSKTSTKDYHADLLKMSIGGDTMLKNPKKADLDKDGKLSGYEKKRGKAIEANMMKANKGMSVKSDNKRDIRKTESMIGASKSSKREKKIMKANVGMAAKKVRENQMMKASTGKSVRGFGAARTSGMGLQDEQLPPGKSLDYYKDLM
jgi:hypothetical protein